MITVGLLALCASLAALAGQTRSGVWHRVGGHERHGQFVGALREEDLPMTSWTAEVEWHEDVRGRGHRRLLAIRGQDWGSFYVDSVTGTVTATVTMDAPDLLLALDAVLLLVRGLAGQPVMVNRITATDAFYNESALSGA